MRIYVFIKIIRNKKLNLNMYFVFFRTNKMFSVNNFYLFITFSTDDSRMKVSEGQ